MGPKKDTIEIDYRKKYKRPDYVPNIVSFDSTGVKYDTTYRAKWEKENPPGKYPFFIEWGRESRFNYGKMSTKISIVIDTKQLINHSLFRDGYKGFPVIVTNLDKDTIKTASGSSMPLVMEAKDSLGKWRPIEKKIFFGCGNGIGTFILPPNNVVLSAAKVYQGKYKTELRLRLNDVFSNTFTGRINYSQFME